MARGAATYPVPEPYADGRLDVGDGHSIYWEVRGQPDGKPAVALHGGPGSGAGSSWANVFDPARYRVVLFDQRGCGRSTPKASQTVEALKANTTQHLIADIESLRRHLAIDRWLVIGASCGLGASGMTGRCEGPAIHRRRATRTRSSGCAPRAW
jgi:proline iminopeptidase